MNYLFLLLIQVACDPRVDTFGGKLDVNRWVFSFPYIIKKWHLRYLLLWCAVHCILRKPARGIWLSFSSLWSSGLIVCFLLVLDMAQFHLRAGCVLASHWTLYLIWAQVFNRHTLFVNLSFEMACHGSGLVSLVVKDENFLLFKIMSV